MFTVERNGVALGRGLVEVMVNYLVETLLVRDASEVDIDEARSIAEDAWADIDSIRFAAESRGFAARHRCVAHHA